MTSKIVVNNIGSDTGINTVTFDSNVERGTSNLHSVGVEVAGINVLGADTPIGTGSTIYDDGGARFSGIVTATSFSGSFDASNLTGTVADARISTLTASKLSGTLPAISGANLTNLPASGKATNLVVNGAMMVAQRGTSSTSSGYHTVDRFNVQFGGTDEAMTVEQANVASGTTPYTLGFLKCLKVTNGNQTSGAGGGDWLEIYQYLEDQDICNSGWNFKSATSYLTISFWVKSSVSQKFAGFFYTNTAGAGNSYTYSYQIDNGSGGNLSANTWTKITHTIPGSSSLTFNNDNTRGFAVGIFPFDGTDYTTSGHTEETWQQWSSSNKLKDMDSTWWTTNDATFEITGLQLEVGQQATTFEHRSFGEELERCRRYYQVILDRSTDSGDDSGLGGTPYTGASGGVYVPVRFNPPMRTKPTAESSSAGNEFRTRHGDLVNFDSFTGFNTWSRHGGTLITSASGNKTVGHFYWIETDQGSAKLAVSAEL